MPSYTIRFKSRATGELVYRDVKGNTLAEAGLIAAGESSWAIVEEIIPAPPTPTAPASSSASSPPQPLPLGERSASAASRPSPGEGSQHRPTRRRATGPSISAHRYRAARVDELSPEQLRRLITDAVLERDKIWVIIGVICFVVFLILGSFRA